jgi:hypothetical protein
MHHVVIFKSQSKGCNWPPIYYAMVLRSYVALTSSRIWPVYIGLLRSVRIVESNSQITHPIRFPSNRVKFDIRKSDRCPRKKMNVARSLRVLLTLEFMLLVSGLYKADGAYCENPCSIPCQLSRRMRCMAAPRERAT